MKDISQQQDQVISKQGQKWGFQSKVMETSTHNVSNVGYITNYLREKE